MAAVPTSARAIVCHDTLQNDGWKMEEVRWRELRDDELLVEMVASGVCHTDVLVGGIPGGAAPIACYPRVLGHEGSGYVRKVGPKVTVAKEGDPVLCSFSFCNTCEICKAGHYSHCNSFMDLNFGPNDCFQLASKSGAPEITGSFFGQSSFAQYSIVRSCSVVNASGLVTDKKELQMMSPLGCGIQTGTGTIVNVAGAGENDAVCIMGLGGVGLAAVMGAKLMGCRTIIGIDRVASRLELARELGCTHVIDGNNLPADKDLGTVVKDLTEGVGPTITVDTTGAPVLIEAGIEFTRNRGKYIQVGSPPFDYTLSQHGAFNLMVSGKSWIGAIEGGAYPADFVPRMIGWYREGKFPFHRLCKLMPVEEFAKALHEMHEGLTIKPILTWS